MNASGLLKKSQVSARQGKRGRENAVATVVLNTPVHEAFEASFDAVSRRMRLFSTGR